MALTRHHSDPPVFFPPSEKPEPAFSLAEVVIAIGIASFAMLAIVGLLSAGLRSSRESAEDTTLALMMRQVNAWSRAQPFSDFAAAAAAASNSVLFFNAEGELTRTAGGEPAATPSASSHYACTISAFPATASTNLIYLQYRFEWPLAAPAAGRQKRIMVTSLANED